MSVSSSSLSFALIGLGVRPLKAVRMSQLSIDLRGYECSVVYERLILLAQPHSLEPPALALSSKAPFLRRLHSRPGQSDRPNLETPSDIMLRAYIGPFEC